MTLWKTRWRLIALVTLCILSFGGAMIGAQDAPDATAEPTVEVTAEPTTELPPRIDS